MRFWIILITVCSLFSLPFSGSMAADTVHDSNAMQFEAGHEQHMSAAPTDEAEHCPVGSSATEVVDDCCDDTTNEPECGSCPPDCGHCLMSDHGSTAALTMQQLLTASVVTSRVIGKSSFYQRLSGQPTPPPIIS